MKLKYYLRGLGIGMLVTALVFIFVIIPNKQNMTDAEIKEAAAKLGMQEVAPKESNVPDTLGTPTPMAAPDAEQPEIDGSDPAEAPGAEQSETAGSEPAEAPDAEQPETAGSEPAKAPDAEQSETAGSDPAEAPDAEQSETSGSDSAETPDVLPTEVPDTVSPDVTTEPTEIPAEVSEITTAEEASSDNPEKTEATVEVEIYRKMTSEQLAAALFEKGLIDDAAEFNRFLITNRYADALKIGTYNVSYGLTYSELAKLFSNR